jgi:hypothetical protein
MNSKLQLTKGIMIVFAAIRNNCGFREQSLLKNVPNSGKPKYESIWQSRAKSALMAVNV